MMMASATLVLTRLAGTPALADETVTLRSGNAAVGNQDPQITFFQGSGPFTAANFEAARMGQQAFVVIRAASWLVSLPSDPLARWIAVDSSRAIADALYAQDFVLTNAPICGAHLSLAYAVDDDLGRSSVPSVYLNGMAVPGAPQGAGGESFVSSFASNAIGPLLRPGLNTVYIMQDDTARVQSGLLYSAVLTINNPIQSGHVSNLACPTRSATFAVTANGTPSSVQWQMQDPPGGSWTNLGPTPVSLACGGTAAASASPANAAQVTIAITPCPTSNSAVFQRRRVRAVVTTACGTETSSEATYTICPADYNCSGGISVQDVFDFLFCYFSAGPACDVDGSGSATVEDIFQFLAAYFTGCS